jgi:type II secretory ATPase GspE/PulE/Tfp pilus assembly ATPase PilB-like protein
MFSLYKRFIEWLKRDYVMSEEDKAREAERIAAWKEVAPHLGIAVDDGRVPSLSRLEQFALEHGIAVRSPSVESREEMKRLASHYPQVAQMLYKGVGPHHALAAQQFLWQAVLTGASTVYLLPTANYTCICYRFGGIGLCEAFRLPPYWHRPLVACYQVMAGLFSPQTSDFHEGRIALADDGKNLGLRATFRALSRGELVTIDFSPTSDPQEPGPNVTG